MDTHPYQFDPTELLQIVADASSQDSQRVQVATNRLKDLLQVFGTLDGLHEIASRRDLPVIVRQQAIIQFKNSALHNWRSRKLLSDSLKARIRDRSLTFLYEEDDLIAGVNELIVAKIARLDYPTTWPNLIKDLMVAIETNLQIRYSTLSSDPRHALILKRSLKVLNAILKELSTMRMLAGVRTMGSVVQSLHLVIYDYYSKISPFFASLDPQTASSLKTADDILLSHLLFKLLVKMAIWLWNKTEKMTLSENASTQAWLRELFQNSAIQLKTISELRISLVIALNSSGVNLNPVARRSTDQLARHVRLFGKFFRRLQQLSVQRFIALPICAELIFYYWDKVVQATDGPPELIADTNEAVFPVRFLVQALVLFKESVGQWSPVRKKGTPDEQTLSREFVEGAVHRLVTRFIPLNPSDLDGWIADPEEWLSIEENEGDHWEYQLRPCGERVLVTLVQQYQQYVVPVLEAKLKEVSAQPTVTLSSVIQKEAVYCAIGRCATRMKDVIPFEQWVDTILLPEAKETNPNFPIIKRRIAWLIGRWLSDMCSQANNAKIWEILSHLLHDRGPGTDAVVRLTAATALRECTDGFDADVFAPFLQSAITDLVQTLAESEALESKRRVAKSLIVVIERAGQRIVPFMRTVAEPIPRLWDETGSNKTNTDWLLKGLLLTIVTTLINSSKEESVPLRVLVIPLVRESLSPGIQLHLDQDGLSLWHAALRNANTFESVDGAPTLLEIFPLAVDLLSENLDLLGKIVGIHESYLLLDATRILHGFGLNLFNAFCQALQNPAVLDTNIKDMLVAIEFLFQLLHLQLAPSSLWGEALHASGLFTYFVKALMDDKRTVLLLTAHIHVLARIATFDAQAFLQLVSLSAQTLKQSEEYVYDALMTQWWARFDNMSEPRHRKLSAMGIAALVATGRPEILSCLPVEILNLWMDVFAEIKESQELADESSSATAMARHWEQFEPPTSYYSGADDTLEYDRRRSAWNADLVRTTPTTLYIERALQAAESVCGAQDFHNRYLSKADPTLLAQIQTELHRKSI